MTNQSEDPGTDGLEEEAKGKEGKGVEVGLTDGESSTFEPEEDPEGNTD